MQYILSEEELNKTKEHDRLVKIAEKNISILCDYYHRNCIRWPQNISSSPANTCDECPLRQTVSTDELYPNHCMAKRPKGFK